VEKYDYTDVGGVGVDPEKRAHLYDAQTECSVVWTNSQGWPVGVMHRFVWHDERFWVTCAPDRKRVPALRARPQSCVIVSSEGTWLGGDVTTTAKTLATVHDDDVVRSWFYPRLAERLRPDEAGRSEFLGRLDTPGRVVIELEPVDWITYDGVRLESALRGIDYDPRTVKPSRNRTDPPHGETALPLDRTPLD
jgi:hypothetical protein